MKRPVLPYFFTCCVHLACLWMCFVFPSWPWYCCGLSPVIKYSLQESLHTNAFLSLLASVTDLLIAFITHHLKTAVASVFGLLPAHPVCPLAVFFLRHACSHNIPLFQCQELPKKVPACLFGFGEGNGNPLQCSCLDNPMDRGAWQATIHGVARVGHDWATKHHHHQLPSLPRCVPHH